VGGTFPFFQQATPGGPLQVGDEFVHRFTIDDSAPLLYSDPGHQGYRAVLSSSIDFPSRGLSVEWTSPDYIGIDNYNGEYGSWGVVGVGPVGGSDALRATGSNITPQFAVLGARLPGGTLPGTSTPLLQPDPDWLYDDYRFEFSTTATSYHSVNLEISSFTRQTQPPVIGAPSDLPAIVTKRLPGGGSRAEQGIAWTGDGWVTSQGDALHVRLLSRFSEDWSQLLEDFEERDSVTHIGDIAWVDGTEIVVAPIEVNDMNDPYRLAAYNKNTLVFDSEIAVPNGLRIAGLEAHENSLYAVEYVENGPATVLVFSGPNDDLHNVLVNVPYANGIAINDGKVYITSGKLTGSPKGQIHVFDLGDFLSSLPPGTVLDSTEDGYGFYNYDVPLLLHAEGLTFREDQLWVALGRDVAQLDTSVIATTRARINQVVGSWSEATLGSLPTSNSSIVLSESVINVGMPAESGNLFINSDSALNVSSQGSLITHGTLQIQEGELSIQGGTLNVRNLVIGGSGSGLFSISENTSSVAVSGRISLEENGIVSIVPGSAIHMTGSDFENNSTSPTPYAEMLNLTLVFEGGPGVVDLLEVAGEDLGETSDGAVANFAFGALILGSEAAVSRVMLIDAFDNQLSTSAADALYVNNLIVNVGSILYLNNLNLYVDGSRVKPGDGRIFGGGLILANIPEPCTLTLLVLYSAIALATLRRQSGR
jgi:hypothetical protein